MSLGLYVHVPFCERKCAYCDFASWGGRTHEESRWISAIEAELRVRRDEASDPLDSVFFGGGTPSALSDSSLERLCRAVQAFSFSPGFEWSTEANPVSLTPTKIAILKDHGVGRISLGVQSFEPQLLSAMGRAHDADGARRALDLVAASGLRWSADLIFALPGQSVDQFLSSLEQLLAWQPQHVSFYGLTFEPGTDFWKDLQRGALHESEEEVYAQMYLRGTERLAASGILRYEVSNFAKPSQECRHNLAYWDADSLWLAAGNSAHGYRPYTRWRNPRGLSSWFAWADRGFPLAECEPEDLDAASLRMEAWFLGLRTSKGVDLEELVRRHGGKVPQKAIQRRLEAGHVTLDGPRLVLCGDGWLLLDAIVVEMDREQSALA